MPSTEAKHRITIVLRAEINEVLPKTNENAATPKDARAERFTIERDSQASAIKTLNELIDTLRRY